ncbi:MAG: hypothetical protein AB2421_14870 [Thermotaleaceae bacterium]
MVIKLPFANQKNALVTDRAGNIHSFRWDNENIIHVCFYKQTRTMEKSVLVENCVPEFDVFIDQQDNIFLVSQHKEGKLLLNKYSQGSWESEILIDEIGVNVYNLNLASLEDRLFVFYCIPSIESNKVFRMYCLQDINDGWQNMELGDIRIKTVLNPFQVIQRLEGLVLGYYNLVNGTEQIFIKTYDLLSNLWKDTLQLTYDMNDKLYLDMLLLYPEELHICYSHYIEGNLIVKHEKHRINGNKIVKISENELSNPENCTYPTLVYFDDKLWTIWTEHDRVVSCYSEDMGITWTSPYLWNESKEEVFVRYKYSIYDKRKEHLYRFNYSFGKDFPDFTFLGFGNLENTTELPLKLKKKEKGEDEIEMEQEVIQATKEEANDENLQKKAELIELQERIQALEGRVDEIESFLTRRRRGFLFAPRE